MKKIIRVALAIVLCLGVVGCGQGKQEEPDPTAGSNGQEQVSETTEAAREPLRVGVIYKGNLNDEGYNALFHKGVCEAAEEQEMEVTAFEGDGEEQWKNHVLAACKDGYDLIIGADPEIGSWIAEYAPDYPDAKFAVMDVTVPLTNVQSVYFEQREAYFLAGALAAMVTQTTELSGINEDAVIGWIGGMNLPVVQEYFAAFCHGATYINPEIQILESYAGSWSDVEEAKEVAMRQIEQGADIFMNLTSAAGVGVLDAVKEHGLYVIAAEELSGEEWKDVTIAEVTNAAERAGYQIVKDFGDGDLIGSMDRYLTMKEEAVKLADTKLLRERIDEETMTEIEATWKQLTKKLMGGEIIAGMPETPEAATASDAAEKGK